MNLKIILLWHHCKNSLLEPLKLPLYLDFWNMNWPLLWYFPVYLNNDALSNWKLVSIKSSSLLFSDMCLTSSTRCCGPNNQLFSFFLLQNSRITPQWPVTTWLNSSLYLLHLFLVPFIQVCQLTVWAGNKRAAVCPCCPLQHSQPP